MELCYFFGTAGGCSKGKDCTYYHPTSIVYIEECEYRPLEPCWFFGRPSGCSKGETCEYYHPPTAHVTAATTTAFIPPKGLCCCCPKPPRPDAEKTPEIDKFVADFGKAYGYTPVILDRVNIPSSPAFAKSA